MFIQIHSVFSFYNFSTETNAESYARSAQSKPVISFMILSLPFSPSSLVETHETGFYILIEKKICESKTKAVNKYVIQSFALGRLCIMTGKVCLHFYVLTRFQIQKSEIEMKVSPVALPYHRLFFFLIINGSKRWQSKCKANLGIERKQE